MYRYTQETGQLYIGSTFLGEGYSGTGPGRNNPDMESVANIGPIPKGIYAIIRPAYQHEHLGPIVMNLEPKKLTNTFGRSLFRVHGNNAGNDASHGCIILGPAIRRQIADNVDEHFLEVY